MSLFRACPCFLASFAIMMPMAVGEFRGHNTEQP